MSRLELQVPSSSRSMRAMRSAHTQPNTLVVSPMINACSNSKGSLLSGQIAQAMAAIRGAKPGLWRLMVASPWSRALRLEADFPSSVRGPLLLEPFLRLAAAVAKVTDEKIYSSSDVKSR